MKIAVIGSRDFYNPVLLADVMELYRFDIKLLVSGGARGADELAEQWARKKGIPVKIFYPDYDKYGRSAPLKRNHLIVEAADQVIAFWDGKSKGTKYTIDLAVKANKLLEVINYQIK